MAHPRRDPTTQPLQSRYSPRCSRRPGAPELRTCALTSLTRPRHVVTAAAAAAALATLLISVLPFIHLAYRSERAHVAIEVAASIVALLVALIVVGRFRRSKGLSDLLLAAALITLTLTNIFFSATPAILGAGDGSLEIWSPLAGRALSAILVMAAAVVPDRTLAAPRRELARAVALIAGAIGAIALVTLLAESALPPVIDPALSPESADRPRVIGPPGLLITYLAIMAMYAIAAVGFTRRAERSRDELITWFAAGAAVSAFSRLNYFLFPSIYSDWVYTGDLLRLAFYLLLFVGAAREIVSYQRELTAAAALEQRKQTARDIHDGFAQEVAFIASHARRLREGPQGDIAKLLGEAADRALQESRDMIDALYGSADEGLAQAIARTARGIAAREGGEVSLDLDPLARLGPDQSESLRRIAGEAVNNAIRHGAPQVWVTLTQDSRTHLTIRDDGQGFDVGDSGRNGFGLRSMRERAEAMGGGLEIRSEPGSGSEVNVWIP